MDTGKSSGREGPAMRHPSALSPSIIWYAALGGMAVLLFLGVQNWVEARRFAKSMDDRLGQIETRITQMSAKVDALPKTAAAPAARRGPDPNKIYTVKTAGRPYKGPKDAPVTIAEFSDFQ